MKNNYYRKNLVKSYYLKIKVKYLRLHQNLMLKIFHQFLIIQGQPNRYSIMKVFANLKSYLLLKPILKNCKNYLNFLIKDFFKFLKISNNT